MIKVFFYLFLCISSINLVFANRGRGDQRSPDSSDFDSIIKIIVGIIIIILIIVIIPKIKKD